MPAPVSPEAEEALARIAHRHQLSREAVLAMLVAVQAGGGTMAQFAIPELGGSGQWMRGGMTMVGSMFDNALKARVDALCTELAELLATTRVFTAPAGVPAASWWPADLGVPTASGGQNDARYAIFAGTRRLAVQSGDGTVRVFDTAEHRIGGVQQQQDDRPGSLRFTSQLGTFDVSSLTEVGARPGPATPPSASPATPSPTPAPTPPAASSPEPRPPATPAAPDPRPASGDAAAIVAAIESLAGLHQRGILSDEEFTAKKTELLGRL